MQVEITPQQAEIITEAFGLSLQALPPAERVAVAAMQYAPIIHSMQQAAKQQAIEQETVKQQAAKAEQSDPVV